MEVLDRRFDVFVAIDLDALLETSVLKRMKKINWCLTLRSTSRFMIQAPLKEEQETEQGHPYSLEALTPTRYI